MSFVIPPWCDRLLQYFEIDGPTGAGVSGGRTSGMMHALTMAANPGAREYQPCFGNTGKEHEATLRFLRAMNEHGDPQIRFLEFRRPAVEGAAPRFAQTVEVDFETAHRGGRVFEDFLETLAAYRRAEKDEGPVAPSAMMRLCTSYMKLKTIHRWLELHFEGEPYTYQVGLRADEPSRVRSLLRQSTTRCDLWCPLDDAGITREMVTEFWRVQPFDLELKEPYGNCSLCFLKDEADIATIMLDDEDEARWWLDIQDRYGDFRRGSTSMRTIFAEAKIRVQVIRPAVMRFDYPVMPPDFTAEPTWLARMKDEAEAAYQRRLNAWEERNIQMGHGLQWSDIEGRFMLDPRTPPKPKPGAAMSRSDYDWARYRWELLIKQEQRLRDEGRAAFSCACESAQIAGANDNDNQLRMW